MNKVWNVVQKIKGNFSKTNVHHLKDGQDALTSEQTISNKLSQTFSKNSSTQNYHPEFQKFIYKCRRRHNFTIFKRN
jgi:hypothetical protein